MPGTVPLTGSSDVKGKRYVLAKDIVLRAGTLVQEAAHTTRWAVPFASALLSLSDDSTAELTMPLDEAVSLGLVEEFREYLHS